MVTSLTLPPCYQKPSGRLHLATTQVNLSDGVNTAVMLDTISTGFTDAIEDTSAYKITPGVPGYYDIKGMVTFINVVASKNYYAGIWINLSTVYSYNISWTGGGTYLGIPVHDIIKLSATDYVNLLARSDSGDDTVDIAAGNHLTYLSVQRVR